MKDKVRWNCDLMCVPPHAVLLRWFNHHLRAAGFGVTVLNFDSHCESAEALFVLCAQLLPGLKPGLAALQAMPAQADRQEALIAAIDASEIGPGLLSLADLAEKRARPCRIPRRFSRGRGL